MKEKIKNILEKEGKLIEIKKAKKVIFVGDTQEIKNAKDLEVKTI